MLLIEAPDFSLRGIARRVVQYTHRLHFIKVFRPLSAAQMWRSIGAELRGTLQGERPDLRNPGGCRRSWRCRGSGSQLIDSWTAAERVRNGRVTAIIGPQGQKCCGNLDSDCNPLVPGSARRNGGKRGSIGIVQEHLLTWEEGF